MSLPVAGRAATPQRRAPASASQIAGARPDVIDTPPTHIAPPVNFRVVTEGLRLPEGPIVMKDGSVLVVEVEGGTLSRCTMDGKVEVIAEMGGGPNGAAIGPDGACYIANNGGFTWAALPNGLKLPSGLGDYKGGFIQRVDLKSGRVDTLYDSVNGRRLSSPNDLVFDTKGGFWFTDWGKPRDRSVDRGGLYYAKADGSMIREVIFPLVTPNGVGLAPDGKTIYVTESDPGHLLAGTIGADGSVPALRLLAGPGGNTGFDSLKVEADGSVCAATLHKGGITRITADGTIVERTPLEDFLTTNLAFGGSDLRTCFVTLSGRGQLVAIDWPRPGLKPNYVA